MNLSALKATLDQQKKNNYHGTSSPRSNANHPDGNYGFIAGLENNALFERGRGLTTGEPGGHRGDKS